MAAPGSSSGSASRSMSLDTSEGKTRSLATAQRDDDDISITSTVPSEPQSEYEVETIYCEEEFEDGVKYLVKWKGYPDERCSWEEGEMFNHEDTLRKWKRKRSAIQRGEVPAFDIEGWYDKIDAWVAAEEDRKRRRRLKRLRCGLPVSDEEGTHEENPQASGNENTTQSDEDSDRPVTEPRRRPVASSPQAPSIERNQNSELRSAPTPTISSPKSKQRSLVRHNESTREPTKERGSTASTTRVATTHAVTRPASAIKPLWNARPRAAPDKPVSFGRSQGPAQRRDIFSVISRRRAQRAKGEAADGKQWKNMSTTRRFEKATRYEPEPDVSQLELRRPSDWAPLQESAIMRRPKDNDSLFVEQDDTFPVQPESQPRRSSDLRLPPRSPIPRTDSLDSKHETPRWLKPPAPRVGPTVRESVPRPRISHPESWTQHYVPGLSKVGKTTDDSGEVHSRKWKQGQLLVHLYYGTKKFEVGDVLLHNLAHGAFRDFMDLKDRDSGRINVCFQETWSLEKFNLLIKRTGNKNAFNGWIEGYPDTGPRIQQMTDYLLERDLIGIFHMPRAWAAPILACYPTKSKSFAFLNDGTDISWGGPLRVVGLIGTLSVDTRVDQENAPREISARYRAGRPERQGRFDDTNQSGIFGVLASAQGSPMMERSPWEKDSRSARDFPSRRVSADATGSPHINKDFRRASTDQWRGLPAAKGADRGLSVKDVRSPSGPSRELGDRKPLSNPTGPSKELLPRPPPTIQSHDPTSARDSTTQESQPNNESQPLIAGSDHLPSDIEMTDVAPNPIPGDNINLDDFFRENFDITFETLATVSGPKKANMFFLIFPKEAQEEYELLRHFLDRHRAVILSNREDNIAWERFANTEIGVVLFHQSFLSYHDLRHFTTLTSKHQVLFWNVSLKTPIDFVDRPMNFQRLFPHGGAFLLTEDIMLHDPDAAVIILAWFQDYLGKKAPGTWKLILRPNVINWLLDKWDEDHRYIIMHQLISKIACEGEVTKIPIEPRDLDSTWDPFLATPIISPANLPGYGSRAEDEFAAIPKGLTQEERNTDHLIEFFGGWAIVNAAQFRRFIVITSMQLQPRWQKWHHLELIRGPEALYKRERIRTDWYREKWLTPQQPQEQQQLSTSSASSLATKPIPTGPAGDQRRAGLSLQKSPTDVLSPTDTRLSIDRIEV